MHERLLDESERDKVGYMWQPFSFDVGDQCLFLPPDSHRQNWEELAEIYSQPGVVVKRSRGVAVTGIDDEYDVIFNINGTATVIQELPGLYLQSLGRG
jgi:hypothetical protein